MTLWLDAQLSPMLAVWISEKFNINVIPVRDLGLRDATDKKIFNEAKKSEAIVIKKDIDFAMLQERFGVPPKVIWLTLR